MRGRIIAAERDANSKQPEHQQSERLRPTCRDRDQQAQEDNEDNHLGDEHRLAAEAVGQAAQEQRADQDAEETCRTDETVLGRADIELVGDQRQRHAGHEHHKAFEEFAGRRQDEDAPLHRRHRRHVDARAVRPDRLLVDIGLDRFSGRHGRRGGTGTQRLGNIHAYGPSYNQCIDGDEIAGSSNNHGVEVDGFDLRASRADQVLQTGEDRGETLGRFAEQRAQP